MTTYNNTMDAAIFDPEEMDSITKLDSDDFGTLFSLHINHLGMTISVYVDTDGTEFFNSDWQGQQPTTCAEMAAYDWYRADEIDF